MYCNINAHWLHGGTIQAPLLSNVVVTGLTPNQGRIFFVSVLHNLNLSESTDFRNPGVKFVLLIRQIIAIRQALLHLIIWENCLLLLGR
jgi:hypothetical protein